MNIIGTSFATDAFSVYIHLSLRSTQSLLEGLNLMISMYKQIFHSRFGPFELWKDNFSMRSGLILHDIWVNRAGDAQLAVHDAGLDHDRCFQEEKMQVDS